MDEDELVRIVQDAIKKQRPYGGFFDWPDREIAEWGVANAFSEAATTEPGLPFRDLRSRGRGEDPPDCEARDSSGSLVAIELTELVDGDTLAATRKAGVAGFAQWDAAKIREQIEERLISKDTKTLKGGPYNEYLVLIHTDEPALSIAQIESALAGHQLPALRQVQRAYLLLSYDPGLRRYPFVRLV